MTEEIRQIRRELRAVKLYAIAMTTMVGVLALAAFRAHDTPSFKEIDVQRINVREPDGKLRMVIADKALSPGPIAYGKPFGYPGGGRPGIIFYNDEETENGGLTFGGKRDADGTFHQTEHLSFDQYNQDQVIVLEYNDKNGTRQTGLNFLDRADVPILDVVAKMDSIKTMPDGPAKTAAMKQLMEPKPGVPLVASRLFVGRDQHKDAVINLADKFGKPRLRLRVDSLGAAAIDFLDANGRVVYSLPDSAEHGRNH